jgi:hypothetical protein
VDDDDNNNNNDDDDKGGNNNNNNNNNSCEVKEVDDNDNGNNNRPLIIGTTGTISKLFRKYVSSIPGNQEVRELQKTAILGTAHILRKVLM